MTPVEVFDRHPCHLGEGPMWDERTGEVFWVDIYGSAIHVLELATGKRRTIETPSILGAVLPRREPGSGWLVALERGLVLLAEDGTVTPFGTFAEADGAEPEVAVRANDGKCDPRGRCFQGTMGHGTEPGAGALYRLDPGESVPRRVLGDVTISNGLAWPADAQTMYYIDTMTRRVDAFDYDIETGEVANRRTFVEVPESDGYPDGMTIDAEDCIWVAFWGGAAVRRYTPDGKLDRVIDLPCPQVTSCAFVGPALDRLVVTTARLGLGDDDDDGLCGATFVVDPGVRGTPTMAFGG
jgi:sugar lactone lactonase YvrE